MSNSTPLHLAVEDENVTLIHNLLSQGHDIGKLDKSGMNCLHLSVVNGNYDIVSLLTKDGAHINSVCGPAKHSYKSYEGYTALHFSVENDDKRITSLLLSRSADLHAQEKRSGNTPLHIAVRKQYTDIVDVLLGFGYSLVNLKNYFGETVLHIAADTCRSDVVELLLRSGADAKLCDKNGDSALNLACKEGDINTVKLLIEHSKAVINAQNNEGFTALHYAANKGCSKMIYLLLKSGAGTDIPDKDGNRPLHYACSYDQIRNVELLLKHHCKVNLTNKKQEVALCNAAERGYTSIVEALLDYGAEVDLPDKYGDTVLHCACRSRSIEIVKLLIDHGCDVNAGNVATPIITAIHKNCPAIIRLLLEAGASIRFVEYYDIIPNTAFIRIRKSIVEDLLLYECSNFFQQFNKEVPLMTSDLVRCFEIFKMLIQWGVGDRFIQTDLRIRNSHVVYHFIRHFVMLKMIGFHTLSNFPTVENSPLNKIQNAREFRDECSNEIKLLKATYFGNSNISFYDLLTRDLSELVRCLRNNEVKDALETEYKLNFPIYGNMLQFYLEQGSRRRLLIDQSVAYLGVAISNLVPLPTLIIEQILDHLNNRDLITFAKACHL